jgi:hypothetical protein
MAHHNLCDACETVSHCSKNGCIPLVPQPRHFPEFILPRTGNLRPSTDSFTSMERWLEFSRFESCMDAPPVLPLGGSYNYYSSGKYNHVTEFGFVGRPGA